MLFDKRPEGHVCLTLLSSHPPGEATTDGSDLLWTVPFVLSPLVHGPFRDRGVRFGVNDQVLSESEIAERRYEIGLQEGRLEVKVPLGAHGGRMKVQQQHKITSVLQLHSSSVYFHSFNGNIPGPVTKAFTIKAQQNPTACTIK